MDTTAAAELGGGVVDGGVGSWDTGGGGGGEAEGWQAAERQQQQQQQQGWVGGDGAGRGGQNRSSGFVGSNLEPPPKRLRGAGGGGGGDGYGSGSGNFNNSSSLGGFGPGAPDAGLRTGYGPGGQGGSPGLMKSNFPPGGPNSGYPHGPPLPPPPLPPGTPTGDQSGMGRGRGMGSIFYKTKLCSRFRNGNCPYNTNCNFAHGMEELRRPPPGWEDVAGPLDGGGSAGAGGAGGGSGGNGGPAGGGNGIANVAPNPPPGPNQGPNPMGGGGGSSDMQRFHKTRPCKKYFSELGCPYGERCNFLHDEPNPQTPSKSGRESVVVTVVPTAGASGSGAAPASSAGGGGGNNGSGGGVINQRPPNWKTRLCNKWETTGTCPFGDKCHFAHGNTELQRYGGGPIDPSAFEGGAVFQMDSKFGMSANNSGDGDEGLPSNPDSNAQVGNMRLSSGLLLQQTPSLSSGLASKPTTVWRGPTEGISTIYGDWVGDEGWETYGGQLGKDSQHLKLATSLVGQRGSVLLNEIPARKEKDQQNSSAFVKLSNGSMRSYAQNAQANVDMSFTDVVM